MHKDATTALEGDFDVVIVEAEAKKTNDGSKDMIKYKAKVEYGPYVGRPLYGNFTISPESPAAMRMLFSHWTALGIDARFFEQNPSATPAQIAQALVGRSACVTVGTRQWQGVDREEIQGWKPKTLGGTATTMGGVTSSVSIPAGTPATPSVPAGTPLTASTPPAASVSVDGSASTPTTSTTVPPEPPF
jgi:hypothetical protein